jgi:pimeloyl-ACP methyl ester carboxylesterase
VSANVIEGMAVEIAGDGVPAICVHGLGGTSNTFAPQMEALRSMRVIRLDLPCAGRSTLIDNPTIPGFVTAVAKLADTLGVKAAHFLGHSMGTLICQHLAVERPELVKSLVLFGALTEPTQAGRDAFRERARNARAGGMSAIADTVCERSTAAETKSRNPAAVAFVRETILRQSPEGYARSCEALAESYAADVSRIRVPTLMITGDEDASTPPSMARELASRIAGARAMIVPRCGHWPTIERAHEVNAELKRFY